MANISAELTYTSQAINKTIANWLEDTSGEQRKIYIDTIFELFYSTESRTFGEMSKNISTNLPIIYKKYELISADDKKMLMDMTKLFAKTYFKELLGKEGK